MRIQRGSVVCVRYDTPDRTHKKHRMYRLVHRVVKIGMYCYIFINEFEMLIRYKNTWTYQKTKHGMHTSFPVKTVEGIDLCDKDQ